MTDISEYYSSSSTALKPSDIDDGLTATIVSWRKKKWDDGNESYFLKLKGVDKEFRLNKTNAKRIAEMYGKNIDEWEGKEITLFPDVTEYQGKSVDTIIVRVRKTARNAPKKLQNGPRDDHPFAPGNDEDEPF